jgi:hypothetical protein
MTWTAPAPASAAVEFDVAANASNDDTPLGDYIYLASAIAGLDVRMLPGGKGGS